jgi:hypothetical protein
VKLTAPTNSKLRWQLTRGRRTYLHGVAIARRGQAKIDLPTLNRLPKGHYALRLSGRGAATTIVVG